MSRSSTELPENRIGLPPENFTDVPSYEYYYYPVGWAQAYGIVYGEEEDLFNPNGYITREQASAILYRYATEYEYMYYVLPDEDIASGMTNMEEYAEPAIAWMLNSGISNSVPNQFGPKSWLYRGLCAEYIWRFMTLAYGDGKVFAMKELTKANTASICESMNDMGYDAYVQFDLRPIAMEFAFYNSSIIFSNSHGGSDCIGLYNGELLMADDIGYFDMAHVDLAYISGCEAGTTFAPALVQTGGADCAIGFSSIVAFTRGVEDNGIHYFNKKFFEYYAQNYTPEQARDLALSDISGRHTYDVGAWSMEIYYYYDY